MRFAPFLILLIFGVARAQSSLESAAQAHKSGELAKAELLYRKALSEDPKGFGVNYNFGLLLLQTKRAALALERFNVAAIVAPSRFEPFIARANAHLSLGKPENALSALVKGEPVCKRVPQYWLLRAEIELSMGKRTEAQSSARFAASASTGDARLLYQSAGISSRAGDTVSAYEALKSAASVERTNAEVLTALGSVCLSLKKFDETIAVSDQLIGLSPKSPTGPLLKTYALEALKQTDQIDPVLDQAIERGAPKAPLLTRKAELHLVSQNEDAAMKVLDEALVSDKDYVPALIMRSRVLLKMGNPKAAALDASRAVQLQPRSSDAYRAAYQALMALQYENRAEACLRSWSQGVPNDPEPLRILGPILEARQAMTEAVTVYEKLVAMLPSDPNGVSHLASAYLAVGRVPDVIKLLTSVIPRGVDTPDIFISLTLAYRMNGETAKAISTLKALQQRHPKDLRGWLLLANTHERLAAFQSALDVYLEVQQRFPTDPAGYQGAAMTYSKMQKYLDSANTYMLLLEKFPKTYTALPLASTAFALAGKPDAADKVWKDAIAAEPNEVQIRLVYATYLAGRKEVDRAAEAFREVLRVDPTRTDSYAKIADLYFSAKNYKTAFETILPVLDKVADDDRAITLFTQTAVASERIADYDNALDKAIAQGVIGKPLCVAYVDSMARRGATNEAIERLKQLADANPKSGVVWIAIARAQAQKNDSAASLASLQKASDLLPTDQSLIQTFASAAEAARDSAKSADAFGKLYALLPKDDGVCLKYAAYLIESNQKQKAIVLLDEAVNKFPNNSELKKLRASLNGGD